MADFDHNLSLADALTEPPPQIEEEVKRDFMATLEAEKFDDVVGEKVGKTDYVPLLDDDDVKAGTQEAKTKPHADGVQVERASATGPAAVVENGDHGIEGSRKVSPGKIMDDQISYKEFLDRNDSWKMDERDRCFDSQLVFKPTDMSEPFTMNREDVLSDLLLLPQEMTGMPTFGDYFGESSEVHVPYGSAGVPEQPPLGPPHSPANVFDPLAFLGEDLGAESLLIQNEAVPASEVGLPEDFFSGTRPLVEAQETPFFEPPVPSKIPEAAELHLPGSAVMGFTDLLGEPQPPEAKPWAPAGSAGPASTVGELVGFEPWFDQRSLPPEEAPATSPEATMTKDQKTKAMESAAPAVESAALEKQEEKKTLLSQHKEKESSSPFPGLQTDEAASKPSEKGSESKAEEVAKPPPSQKAEEKKPSPPVLNTEARESELLIQKVEETKTAPSQHTEKVEESKASFSQPAEEAATKPLSQKVEEAKPSPTRHSEKAPPSPPSGKQKEHQPPFSPSQPVEHLPVLEKPEERSKEAPSKPAEKQEEHKQSPAKPVERLPEPEAKESKEPVPLGEPKAEPKEPFPGAAALDLAGADKPKEVPGQPVEQPQEKAPRDPEGVSAAQVRQANKSSDHRRFAKAKPARVPLADSPEELLAHFPGQRSQGEDLFAMPEWGYVTGTSPRGKPAPRKIIGQLFELGEGQKDVLKESWDLETSAALKKKKKKPKQKRSQHPRSVETWEESPERLRTPLSADEPQKFDAPLTVPQEVTGISTGVLWKDTSKHEMEWQPLDAQSLSSAPVKREPIQHIEGSLKLKLDGEAVQLGRAEVISDDRAKLLSKSRKKGFPKEQVKGLAEPNKPGSPTSPPAQASPMAISIFGENMKWEGQPPKNVGLGTPVLEAKPTVSSPVASSVEAAKPADVAEKEGPTAGSGVWEGKPKQQGSDGKGRRAGKEAASSPSEREAVEASKEETFPGEDSPAASEPAAPAKARTLPDDTDRSSPVKSEKSAFGSGEEDPFSRKAHPVPGKPPAPVEVLGGGKGPLADANEAVCSSPSEKSAVAVPRAAADQPKKRSSDGKSRKAKDYSEQQLLLSEEALDLRQGLAAEEGAVLRGTGLSATSHSGLTENKVAHGSAGAGEKPKKKSGDRKSRRAAERSSFAPSFFLEVEKRAGSLPVEVNEADEMRETTTSRKKAGSEAAKQLLEEAADALKLEAPSALPQAGKPNVPPTSGGEQADFPSSAYPFIMETPAEVPEHPPTFEADDQTEGTATSCKGKGPHSTNAEDSIMAEPSSAAPTSKPKKRASDGRCKKSGKHPTEQPEPIADIDRPPKASTAKETDEADKGDSIPLEQPGGSQVAFPALKLMERPEGEKDEDCSTAARNSCSEQPPASAHKMSPVRPEPLPKIKDAPSTHKGPEVSLAPLEHLAEAITTPQAHAAPKELAKEEPKIPVNEGQTPQVQGILEAKLDTAGPVAACKEGSQMEKGPSPTKDKGRAVDNLLRDAEAAGQIPVVPLVEETAKGVHEERTRTSSSGVDPLFRLGVEAEEVPGAEIYEKPKGRSDRCRKEARDGSSELASRQDPCAKPAKRGSDGKSKKVTISPEQPVLAPAKADPSQGQLPKEAGLKYALEATEFVDENRNIRNFPPGHPMLWDGNTIGLFGPFGSPGPAALEEASFTSQCPFLKYQGRVVADLRKEQLSPPESPKDPSRGEWKDKLGLQEDSAAGEVREAMIETSLLVKAGDKTREKRKKTKQASLDRVVKQDAKAEEDPALPSVLAEAGGGGVNLLDKIASSGLPSSEIAVMEEKTRALSTVAGAEGSRSPGREAIVPPAELPTPWENNEEAAELQALTAALVGGRGELEGSSEGPKIEEQRISECPESLGRQAVVDKATEDVPAAEAASANKPQDCFEPLGQGDAKLPALYHLVQPAGREEASREAAERMTAQGIFSETGQSAVGGLQAVAEHPDRAARGTKREERARPVEQIKGYMRPTKSRGLPPPPPPLRAAVPEPGKRRPAKADCSGLHRQERGVCACHCSLLPVTHTTACV